MFCPIYAVSATINLTFVMYAKGENRDFVYRFLAYFFHSNLLGTLPPDI